MSDRTTITQALERVERRIRINRLLKDLTLGFSISLAFPLFFKLWDLLSPFSALTVRVIVGVWAAGFGAYVLWKLTRRKGTLLQAASAVDRKAGLHDELKTACWFIGQRISSPWVDLQIQRAARTARGLDVRRLYPWMIPRGSFTAAGLLLLLISLNFVPLPWAHNWLYSQPAYALSPEEQAFLNQVEELLRQAESLEDSEIRGRIEEILKDLQEDEISVAEAVQQLQELEDIVEEGNLELGSINEGLEEMAKDLTQSEKAEQVANAMLNNELMEAAEQFRKMAQEMGMTMNPPEINNELQKSLEDASEHSQPGLESLAQDLKEASESLKDQDQKGAQQSLERAASDLENLSRKMESQQLRNEASRQMKNLAESLKRQERQQAQPQQQEQAGEGQSQQQQAQAQQSSSTGQQGQQGQERGQPGEADQGENEGTGQDPSGSRFGNPSQQGPPTSLEVQLKEEKLSGQYGEGDGKQKQEMIEESSRQERSKLDYRNVASELSSAQQDLLNQDRIPWQYRQLIKNYFQAIRARGKND